MLRRQQPAPTWTPSEADAGSLLYEDGARVSAPAPGSPVIELSALTTSPEDDCDFVDVGLWEPAGMVTCWEDKDDP